MTVSVKMHTTATRHVAGSGFSFCMEGLDYVCTLTQEAWNNKIPGFTDGVWKVPVNPSSFLTGVVELKEGDILLGSFEKRQGNKEDPRKHTHAIGNFLPALSCEIIVFSSELLAANNENTYEPDGNTFEIVSINASPTEGPTPIGPFTMMANYFKFSGGTPYEDMSVEEFVKELEISARYWSNKAMAIGDNDMNKLMETIANNIPTEDIETFNATLESHKL
tara:strand:+ start:228 stop:890 length:663 start_codon:yes stop_codon:yes gene_type:complete